MLVFIIGNFVLNVLLVVIFFLLGYIIWIVFLYLFEDLLVLMLVDVDL